MTMEENDRWVVSKEKLLDSFAKSVKLKLYKKIDYKIWRAINGANSDRVIIKKVYTFNSYCMSLETTGVYGNRLHVVVSLSSWAPFLNPLSRSRPGLQ